MAFCLNEQEQQKLSLRLNRIEGQVRGINKMIYQQRDCIEVLNQIASLQAALKGVWLEVVRGHLKTCVKNGLISDKNFEDLADELVAHLGKIK